VKTRGEHFIEPRSGRSKNEDPPHFCDVGSGALHAFAY